MMLDEPASGLSRGERVALTELLLAARPAITLILIEHDMDVALRVAERVTMMHDGRVIVEGTPDEIRANQTVHDLYLGRGYGQRWLSRCSSIEGLNAFYGPAQALEDVSFEIAGGATSIVGRNGMGKTTLCNAIMGVPPARVSGSIRFRRHRARRPRRRTGSRSSGIGYVPQGRRLFPSLSVDEHLRMLAGARRLEALDGRPRLRALPAPRRAEAQRRRRSSRAASSRCSRSAAPCSRTRRC